MSIQPGDAIPAIALTLIRDGMHPVRADTLFAGRRIVLFSVPGAFTPTCSSRHLPGYVAHFTDFQARGIEVACVAVNDAYVMQAWASSQNVPAQMMMLADGNGDFARALGLELDASAYGMGLRSRRFALLAEDGIVRLLQVEAPGEFKASSAEAMLALIG
ncbi:peroxiredoxin [Dokdonella koreensis]|uniref:Glutathione-dependent peroxiredoxin n=1 Tax=Dokdonella koreensis DS-123 TaxID=1300342 RepID=A0A160DVD9_9GAMM|nr:peroxiredoxin [Dokdonella koreensis]ANB18071.1 Peroxiredoxin [Dokdonella koreensis DS-123]